MTKKLPRAISFAIGQTVLVIAGMYLGRFLNDHISFIPKAIGSFHVSDLLASDWLTMIGHFVFWSLTIFLGNHLVFGSTVLRSPLRAARTIYALILVMTVSSLSLFFFSTVNFNPNLFVGIALASALLFSLTHVAGRLVVEEEQHPNLAWKAVSDFFRSCVQLLFSIRPFPYILIIVFAATPVLLASLYKSDRAFASSVTKIRMMFNSSSDFAFTPVRAWEDVTFRMPMQVQFSPADPSKAYILERHGRLYRLDQDDPKNTKELLIDFSDRVGYVEIELGALGFDHHPDFDAQGDNQFVYIMYTDFVQGVHQFNRLSRFDLGLPTPEARLDSEQVLFELGRKPDGWHNGGSVEFGPDGFLYAAIGDALDSSGHQRIDQSFMGTIVRIDVDQRGGGVSHPPRRQPANGMSANYYVPSDNPFVGHEGANEEIYALGLRNPFRISFDPATDMIWAGDVGSTKWEEVNIIRPGGNYQYPFIEGFEPTGGTRPDTLIGKETEPVLSYVHTAYERAIIGGIVYRRDRLADLQGKYIFADNYSGHIYAMEASGEKVETADIIGRVEQFAQQGVTSLTTAPDGSILITTLGSFDDQTGEVLRLLPTLEAERYLSTQAPLEEAEEAPIADINAAELYQNYCARCHGEAGAGEHSDLAGLEDVAMPDFTSMAYQESRTDEFIKLIIANGGGREGISELMPPWELLLSEAEIDALVSYIRSLPDRDIRNED